MVILTHHPQHHTKRDWLQFPNAICEHVFKNRFDQKNIMNLINTEYKVKWQQSKRLNGQHHSRKYYTRSACGNRILTVFLSNPNARKTKAHICCEHLFTFSLKWFNVISLFLLKFFSSNKIPNFYAEAINSKWYTKRWVLKNSLCW